MQLGHVKLCAALALLVLTFAASMLPLFLINKIQSRHNGRERPRHYRVVSFLSCFGGGVFLATCLLHLFPDVKEQMVLIFKTLKIDPNYPVAEFLLAFGFLMVLIIEQIVLNCQEKDDKEKLPFLNHQHSHSEVF